MKLLVTNDAGNVASPLSGTGQGDRQVGQGRECLPSTRRIGTPCRQRRQKEWKQGRTFGFVKCSRQTGQVICSSSFLSPSVEEEMEEVGEGVELQTAILYIGKNS